MNAKILLGALVISAGLCSQGFSGHLLGRMMHSHNGCGASCCETSCCEPSCCDSYGDCCDPCGSCCEPCWQPKCCHRGAALFRGLFSHHGCCDSCGCDSCGSCCESSCCDHGCGCGCHKTCLLEALFGGHGCGHGCGCCESSCCTSGYSDCCGGGGYDGYHHEGGSPTAAPDESAPVPPAQMADPSARRQSQRRVQNASRVIRN